MRPEFPKLSVNEIFARNVKACREAKGLTQKQLAEEILGYPEDFICKVEQGLPIPCKIGFYVELANELGVSIEALTNRYFSLYEHNIVKENATSQFVFGEHGAGKEQALREHHENLKNEVRKASHKLSVTCNEKTRQQYDKAIEKLIVFENSSKFKPLLK